MKLKQMNKRKGVSPVIAVILLIGLTVLAGAVLSFYVLPMLTPAIDVEKVYITYDSINEKITIINGNSRNIYLVSIVTDNASLGMLPKNIIAGGSLIYNSQYLIKPGDNWFDCLFQNNYDETLGKYDFFITTYI